MNPGPQEKGTGSSGLISGGLSGQSIRWCESLNGRTLAAVPGWPLLARSISRRVMLERRSRQATRTSVWVESAATDSKVCRTEAGIAAARRPTSRPSEGRGSNLRK